MYAEVVVNAAPLNRTYSYAIPEGLRGRVGVGHLVTVPFNGRRAQGIVADLAARPGVARVSDIEDLIDPEPVLSPAQIELARWISNTYVAPLVECLVLMLPPGLSRRADVLLALNEGAAQGSGSVQQALLDLLAARGALRGRQIDRALPRGVKWRAAAEGLVRRGLISRQSVLDPPAVSARHVRTARLAATMAAVEAARPHLARTPAKAARLSAVLDFLANEFEPVDVSWVYAETGAKLQDLRELAERGLVDLGEAEVWRDSLAGKEFVPTEPPRLTPDQQRVWEAVAAVLETAHTPEANAGRSAVLPILLHGVTGSGKTEIYLRALAATLKAGRRAIVLVPEIALTPQTVRRFATRFPGRVAVWHSELGQGERYDTWRRARLGLVDVVIGPRSALFAPLPGLGLIVLDEEHDEAYKQDPPHSVPYHAREAAVAYAGCLGAVCLMGSATPDIVSHFRGRQGQYHLLELPRRIMGHARRVEEQAEKYRVAPRYRPASEEAGESLSIELPEVEVVDLRQELRAGNTSIFSRRLQSALAETLARQEQAILFLNRRGTATFVFCRDCGQAIKCDRCDMPLTYHGGQGPATPQLVCHHCNFRRPQPERCPNCGSYRVKYFGSGTEKVEDVLRSLFPQARPLRWDHDATRFKGAHELILQQFSSRQADVLIGTQMIAKGLDLPMVTLVGVISGDVGLGLPDYRASERTFQVLTQVAGRAGRGLLGGRVVLQTYYPDHYVIRAAARHDYGEFYARELRYRKELGYPPFRRVMRLLYRDGDNARAEREATALARDLRAQIAASRPPATDVVGPAPCFFGKIGGEFRWHIIVRSPDPAALVRGRSLRGWAVDVDPMSML
jgi:primosomal protein N' (replication factor Y) (superfamily II helicase)